MENIKPQTRVIRQPARTVPEVNINDTSAEDRLLAFVDEQIQRMRSYTSLGGGTGNLTFFELNEALKDYSSINCSYIALDVLCKEELQKAKDAYDDFIAEHYTIVRTENNLQSLSAQKWLSTQEIMYLVQSDPRWRDEYKRLRQELSEAEKKVAFCRRMLDNLESYKYNIGTLSKNIVAEVTNMPGLKALGVDQQSLYQSE